MDQTKCQHDLCMEPLLNGGEGFCKKHFIEYKRRRWSLDNGWKGIMWFAFECFPELVKDGKYGMADFHPEIYKALYHCFTAKDREDSLFAFFTHRYSGKTTVGPIIGTLYALAFDLKHFIVYRADSLGKAQKNFLRNVRRGIESQKYQFIFGNMVPTKKDYNLKDTEAMLIVKNNVFTTLICMGIEQSSRSLINYGVRPDLFFWDDVEHKNNTKTDPAIADLKDKVLAEDLNAIDNEGAGIMTQTPIVMNGLYQSIEKNPRFKVIHGPIWKMKDGEFVLDEAGNKISNWPKMYPPSKIKNIEESCINEPEQGRKYFWREYLLILLPDDEIPFDPKWIKYCLWEYKREHGKNWLKITEIGGYVIENPRWEPINIVYGVDPATSEDGKACDSSCSIIGCLPGNRIVAMDYFKGKYRTRDVLNNFSGYGPYDICLDVGKIDKRGIIGEIFRFAVNKYVPDVVAIETIVEYENTYRELTYSYEHWFRKNYKFDIRFESYKPHGGDGKKRDRIRNQLSTPYENNLVYHTGRLKTVRDDKGRFVRDEIPMKDLFDQLVNISISDKIDLVDAHHIAVRYRHFPEPTTEEDFVMSEWKNENEEYSEDFIVNAHEALI